MSPTYQCFGEFEVILLHMEVALVNVYQLHPIMISLSSNIYFGQRSEFLLIQQNQVYGKVATKQQPQTKQKNAVAI